MSIKDLAGQRFGKLTVVSLAEPGRSPGGQAIRRWNCRCDCGKDVVVNQSSLTASKNGTKSCGCSRANRTRNRIGERHGRLTVIGRKKLPEPAGNGEINGWLCKCDCGKEIVVRSKVLSPSSKIKSCGCLLGETAKAKICEQDTLGRRQKTYLSKTQEGLPARPGNKTGVRGVSYQKSSGLYRARITYQKRDYHIGSYKNIEDAIAARKAAEKALYGEAREEWAALRKGKTDNT